MSHGLMGGCFGCLFCWASRMPSHCTGFVDGFTDTTLSASNLLFPGAVFGCHWAWNSHGSWIIMDRGSWLQDLKSHAEKMMAHWGYATLPNTNLHDKQFYKIRSKNCKGWGPFSSETLQKLTKFECSEVFFPCLSFFCQHVCQHPTSSNIIQHHPTSYSRWKRLHCMFHACFFDCNAHW